MNMTKSYNPETYIHELGGKRFCHGIRKYSQKVFRVNVVRFGSLGWIPMIQPPFNSPSAALQYETGSSFP